MIYKVVPTAEEHIIFKNNSKMKQEKNPIYTRSKMQEEQLLNN